MPVPAIMGYALSRITLAMAKLAIAAA